MKVEFNGKNVAIRFIDGDHTLSDKVQRENWVGDVNEHGKVYDIYDIDGTLYAFDLHDERNEEVK